MVWKSIKVELPMLNTEVLVRMYKPDVLGHYVVAKLSDRSFWTVGELLGTPTYLGVGSESMAFEEWSYID